MDISNQLGREILDFILGKFWFNILFKILNSVEDILGRIKDSVPSDSSISWGFNNNSLGNVIIINNTLHHGDSLH